MLHVAGYIIATFTTTAFEVSKCYSMNGKNYMQCYYTGGYVMSWNEAREFCANRNSTLPIITDEDTDNVFQQFIESDSYSEIQNIIVWIGAHARPFNDSAKWHWINKRPSGLLRMQNHSVL